MALPTTRAELVTYIKRRLGAPVITVNVDDNQVDDRIEDALAFFQEYHFDASERAYLKHQITYSNLTCNGATTGTFANGEFFRGATSNAVGKVYTQANTTFLQFVYSSATPANTFTVGETITGNTSGATATIGALALGDWDNQYIPVSNLVMSVQRVVHGGGADRGTGLFSAKYQFLMSDLSWLQSGSVTSYYLTKSHLELLSDMFNGDVSLRFNRHVGRLYLDIDWEVDLLPNEWLVVEAQRVLDPATYSSIWKDRFLRDYATALVKKQWGQNLMKYESIQMPGGITLNGRAIYDEGERESQELEEEIRQRYQLPPEFYVM